MGFFDGTGKTAKFANAGDVIQGTIVGQLDPRTRELVPYLESQKLDFKTKKPLFWEDGNAQMQATILVKTDERIDDDDDGQRTIYVDKTRMKRAIQDACREAKVGGPQIGGILQLWMTGQEPSKGGQDAKTFAARYYPPAGSLSVETPAPAAPAAVVPPAPVAVAPAPVAPAPVAVAPAPVATAGSEDHWASQPAAPVAPPAPVAPAPVAPAPVAPVAPAPVAAAPVAPAAPVAAQEPPAEPGGLPF